MNHHNYIYHSVVPYIYSLELEGLSHSEIVSHVFLKYGVTIKQSLIQPAIELFELELQLATTDSDDSPTSSSQDTSLSNLLEPDIVVPTL